MLGDEDRHADAGDEEVADAAGALSGGLGRDQLHNPGTARPALLDVSGRFLGPELPARITPVTFLLSRCGERDLALSLELSMDLPMERRLVGFDGQSDVGALLEAPAEKSLRRVQRIGLDQLAFQVHRAEQLLERRALAGFRGVVVLLRQGDTKGAGVDGDLGDKPVVAVCGLDRGAFESLAITDQLIQSRCPTWDLADHPGLQHLAELLELRLVEEIEERRIRRPALEVQAERLVQRFPVPLGEGLPGPPKSN